MLCSILLSACTCAEAFTTTGTSITATEKSAALTDEPNTNPDNKAIAISDFFI